MNALTQHTHPHSSDEDSGEFFATLDLHPQPEEVLAVKSDHPHATMSVKGGETQAFKSTPVQHVMWSEAKSAMPRPADKPDQWQEIQCEICCRGRQRCQHQSPWKSGSATNESNTNQYWTKGMKFMP